MESEMDDENSGFLPCFSFGVFMFGFKIANFVFSYGKSSA